VRVLRRHSIQTASVCWVKQRSWQWRTAAAEVYVETMRITGTSRFGAQMSVGQPESEYAIAVYDVARGAFSRSMTLPRRGVAGRALRALRRTVGRAVSTAHQVRLIDPKTAGR